LDKICVRNEEGKVQVQYLKAHNILGQVVFVEVDQPGYVSSPGLTYRSFSGDNGLPASLKQGTISSVYNYLPGIVFPCTNALVITHRGETNIRPTEINLLQEGEEEMKDCGLYLPYPLLRLSEIETDEKEILRQTDLASKQIFDLYFRQEKKTLKKLENQTDEAMYRLKEFISRVKEFRVSLFSSKGQLRHLTQKFLQMDESKRLNYYQEDKPRYLQWNLYRRAELELYLLSQIQKLNSFYTQIQLFNQELGEGLRQLETRSQEISQVSPLE
jgi:hypothetical protein